MNGNSRERATPLIISAMRMACSSLSMTQGPAMRNRLPLPMRTSPTWNSVFRLPFSVLKVSVSKATIKSVPATSDAKADRGGKLKLNHSSPVFLGGLGDLGVLLSSSYFFRPLVHVDGG